MEPIAHIRSPFAQKFGVPRQASVASLVEARVVFLPPWRRADCLRGIEQYSHLWLIWQFHLNGSQWSPTVRPPRLGGNTRLGVFATRSPFRPNPIGLSAVQLLSVDWDCAQGPQLLVAGADLVDGTPIYDIKPYIAYADAFPEAQGGFTSSHDWPLLEVCLAAGCALPCSLSAAEFEAVKQVLAQDPRPAYQQDAQRMYHLILGAWEFHFRIEASKLIICSISPYQP